MSEDKTNDTPAEATAAKKGKVIKAAAVEARREAYIYLGPSLPGAMLSAGSVYKGKSKFISGLFEKAPELEKLFIEVKSAPAFKAELNRQGSEAHRLYQNVETLIREGVLNDGL